MDFCHSQGTLLAGDKNPFEFSFKKKKSFLQNTNLSEFEVKLTTRTRNRAALRNSAARFSDIYYYHPSFTRLKPSHLSI